MSADIKGRKRKSGDDVVVKTSKKVKTVKSAERPAPVKSVLKKTITAPVDIPDPAPKQRSQKAKTEKKPSAAKSNGKTAQKKTQKALVSADSDAEDDDDDGGIELSTDQTAALIAGFSSDESDADDDNDAAAPDPEDDPNEGLDVSTLPKPPTSTTALSTSASDPESTPGIVYIGRIPHGFYEKQLRAYFSQFGEITHLRLARNRRTGRSKHFAFLEFASAAVADIVARTMDKYLLFGHLLQARVVPPGQVKDPERIWLQAKTPWRPKPHNKIERGLLRRGLTREGWEKRVEKEVLRRAEKKEKLKELGYEFEMPAVKPVRDVRAKAKALEVGPKGAVAEGEVKKGSDGGVKGPLGKGLGDEDEEAVVDDDTIEVKTQPVKTTVVEKKVTKKRKPSGSDTAVKGRKKAVRK